MSQIHISRLYRRLINSPKYRKAAVYTHEAWITVVLRRIGCVLTDEIDYSC